MAGIDFTPDIRSVWFDSLSNTKGYEKIYQQGVNNLNNISLFNENNIAKTEEKFNIALKILKDGITSEQQTEQAYFSNLIKSIDNKNKEIFQNQIETIFRETIDYIAFINLINTILLGTENYKSILSLENQRQKDLSEALQKLMKETPDEQIKEKKLEIRNTYLERHSFRNDKLSSFLSNVPPTIDYILADAATQICNEVLDDPKLLSTIKTEISKNQNLTNSEIEQLIINKCLRLITEKTPEIISSFLNKENINITKLIDDLEEELCSNAEYIQINGEDINFGKKFASKNISIDKKTQEIEVSGTKLAENLLKILQQNKKVDPILIDILNKKDKDSSILEKISELNNLIQQANALEEQSKQLYQTDSHLLLLMNNWYELKNSITNLKKEISQFARQELNEKIRSELTTEAQISIAEDLKKALTISTIKITGPEFSEIIDSIIQQELSQNLLTFFSGPKNLKADTITIQINPQKIKTNFDQKKINTITQTDLNQAMTNFYNTFQQNLPKSGESTSFKQGRFAWRRAIGKIYTNFLKENTTQNQTKQEQLNNLKQFAEQIKNTIIITETMKTFTQYQNDLGFISGSLGPTILQQINNFSELFEKAGVPMSSDELTWLEVAIINCAPAALGDSNQGPIEKYLSALAGFAVFDEGSAEIEIIAKETTTNNFYINNSPRIMHLYKLNGMYFPGSYILQRIYDNLQLNITQASSQIDQTINTDGVKIRATADESLINKKIEDEGKRWADTYKKASSSSITSLNITFLSGLLNIVKQLQDAMSSPFN